MAGRKCLSVSHVNDRQIGGVRGFYLLFGSEACGATVARPSEPKPGANALPLEHVVKVFDSLAARVKQNNRGWKTLARVSVFAETGTRHSQVMRLQSSAIWLDHDPLVVLVNLAGKSGKPHSKPLTGTGVEAFRLFIEKQAFGKVSQSSVYKSWRLACEDAEVPLFNPYRLRHTWVTTLRVQGMDLADVQELAGHTSAKTTERYAMVAPHKLMGRLVLSTVHGREHAKTSNGNEPKPRLKRVARTGRSHRYARRRLPFMCRLVRGAAHVGRHQSRQRSRGSEPV